MRDHLEIILPAALDLSHMVRGASKETFKWMGFSPRAINQWELIVDELFMNAVEYGSHPETATIYLSFKKTKTGALFQIEDEGSGSKKITATALKAMVQQHQKEAQLTDTSGRGLALIMEKWTTSHHIEQSPKGGILIRVEKIHAPEEDPASIEEKTLVPASLPDIPSKVIVVNEHVGGVSIEPYIKPIQEAADHLKPGQSMELNFERVKYINSIFIGHLADWYNQVHAKKAFLELTHLNKDVKEILNLVGLNKIFNLKA